MRFVILLLIPLFALATGCANAEQQRDRPDEPDEKRPSREDLAASARTFHLDSPTSVVGFGDGSLWVVDYGDYECDDTASCSGPERVFIKRLDPDTREVEATVPLRSTEGAGVAFGAGSAWIAYENYDSPSKSGVLRLDLDTNEVSRRIPMKNPAGVAFGGGSVWVTDLIGGTVSRIDPGTNEVVEEIRTGKSDLGGVAVGEDSVWVASYGAPEASALPEEAYETDTLPNPNPEARLLRLDPKKGDVVAEIPVEETALEGGASDVVVGEGAVWVTSVNAKLLRVDPETNEVTARNDIGDYSFDVETGEGRAWALSEVNVNSASGYTIRLSRLDGESGEISGHLDRKDMSGLAVGGGAVWAGISDIEKGEGGLIKLAP